MSQSLVDDWPLDAPTTDGIELADILNRFNQAVNSSNSGATEPPSKYPGMPWLDTSGAGNGVFKIRNVANTGWIILADLSSGGGMASLFADGAVAAPSIAFNSEPGLGWYRHAASLRGFSVGGAGIEYLNAQVANTTTLQIYPRTAGSSSVNANAQPNVSANNTGIGLFANAAESGISAFNSGASAALPMVFRAATRYAFDNEVWVQQPSPQFRMLSTGGAGSSTTITMARPSGGGSNVIAGQIDGARRWQLQLGGSTSGDFSVDRFSIGDAYQGSAFRAQLSDGTAFVNGASFPPNGGLNGGGDISCGGARFLAYANNNPSKPAILQSVQIGGNTAAQIVSADGGASAGATFFNDGRAQNGQNIANWWTDSDRRLKDRIEDYTEGLAEILALRPRTFHYVTGLTDIEHVGIVADEAESAMPRLIDRRAGTLPDGTEVDDLAGANVEPMVWALVNAVKTLDTRIGALEGTRR